MPAPAGAEDLVELLHRSGILTPPVLRGFLDRHDPLPDDPRAIARLLVTEQLLTAFQAKLLLVGRYKGFRLGSHKLLDQIGQGGMGAVYLGEHETSGLRVAIKVLPPGGNRITIERFLREARSAAALDHPNIVKLLDSGREGTVHYLVLEYVEGRTLDRVVKEDGPLTAELAVDYIRQVAAGLQHAYEKGLIHRDIKPSNMILTPHGVVKLLDMGLARTGRESDMLTDQLDAGTVVGTADFISPEQASNAADIDIRGDLYSLGATFFTLVAGRPPFPGSVASKLLQHQLDEPPPLDQVVEGFPQRLARIVSRLLAKRPADRFQTPAEFIAAVESWQIQTMKSALGRLTAKNGTKHHEINREDKAVSETYPRKVHWLMIALGFAVSIIVLFGIVAVFFS